MKETLTQLEQTLLNEVEHVPDLCHECDTPVAPGERICAACHNEGMWIDVAVDRVLLDG